MPPEHGPRSVKLPTWDAAWPESWRRAHDFDRLEIVGPRASKCGQELGYARAYRERFRRTIDAVTRAARAGASVLDVAAAQGNFTLALAERGYRVTWNDLRAELAAYVRLKHEFGDVHYAEGNCFDVGFASEFDVVLITEIIEHVAHPDQFLRRIASLVRPGGTVVMTTPNGAYLRNRLPRFTTCANPERFEPVQFKPDADGHIFLLCREEVHALAQGAGLDVEHLSLFTNPLTRGTLGLARLLPYLPARAVEWVERVTALRNGTLFPRVNIQILAVLRRPPTAT